MKIVSTLLPAAAVAVIVCVARDASALGPLTLEAGAKIGAGTNPTGDTINPLGFGIGARAGVSIFNVYGGLNFMYYLGGSSPLPSGSSGHRSGKSVFYGLEGGYDFSIVGLFTLRPQLGIGVYNGNFDNRFTVPTSADGKNLYLEPGVTAVVPLGLWFVGADANLLFLPGQSGATAGFTFHGQVGLRL